MDRATAQDLAYANLMAGDPAPWFHQRSTSNANYAFDTAAGRYIVLCFFATAADTLGRASIQSILAHRHYFDDVRFSFFGVSLDPRDETQKRVSEALPGIRFFWDSNGVVSRLYGSVPKNPGSASTIRRFWIVLDPTLRVLRVIPFAADGSDAAFLFSYLEQLPPPDRFAGTETPAPILFLPNVFEESVCFQLIDLYRKHGGVESGFMREVDGTTVRLQDRDHTQRRDSVVQDPDVIRQLRGRIVRRIVPEVLKIHSFKVTRMERYLVGCYSAEHGGHFRAHRDN